MGTEFLSRIAELASAALVRLKVTPPPEPLRASPPKGDATPWTGKAGSTGGTGPGPRRLRTLRHSGCTDTSGPALTAF